MAVVVVLMLPNPQLSIYILPHSLFKVNHALYSRPHYGDGCLLLYANMGSILDGDLMALCNTIGSMKCQSSYGQHFLDHLAADGAGFPGGQVTVVAFLQVDANLL